MSLTRPVAGAVGQPVTGEVTAPAGIGGWGRFKNWIMGIFASGGEGGAATTFTFLDADDTGYVAPLTFLDADDTSYSVPSNFLDADDTSYAM